MVASLITKHGKAQARAGLSSCGIWAQLLCGTWDLPGPGLNLCPLRWQADSYRLDHQGSPNQCTLNASDKSYLPHVAPLSHDRAIQDYLVGVWAGCCHTLCSVSTTPTPTASSMAGLDFLSSQEALKHRSQTPLNPAPEATSPIIQLSVFPGSLPPSSVQH